MRGENVPEAEFSWKRGEHRCSKYAPPLVGKNAIAPADEPLVAGGQGRASADVASDGGMALAQAAATLVLSGILCTSWCLS